MADSSIRPKRVLLALSATLTVTTAIAQEQPTEPLTQRAVVFLHTEFLPVQESDGVIPVRLVRELGRQAVLIAARDEFALATRDETLGEAFPEAVTDGKKDLSCKVRIDLEGTTAREDTVRVELSAGPDASEAERAKRGTPMHANFDATLSVAKLTSVLEPKSRSELVKRLGELGFAGKALAPSESNRPPESIEELLLEMNFVSQFAAVRAAHAAIREKGQSSAWLGVLARGYAQLGLMTGHHWRSDNEAFAARALLYAERMLNADPRNPLSRAHRAYVRALAGLHAAALEDLDVIEKAGNEGGDAPLPGWVDLIRPFCAFQREPIRSIADRRQSLRQLAQRLSFEQHRAFGDDRWLFESAGETMQVCPDEYGIYAALTGEGAPLAVGRIGANYGPAALARFLPERIAKLPDLPTQLRDVVGREGGSAVENGDAPVNDGDESASEDEPQNDSQDESEEAIADGEDEASGESPIVEIVQALREVTMNGGDNGEPSWASLGTLIAEEQFVQAANYLNISTNATESSLAEIVDAVRPAVKDHRFARFVDSYSVNVYRETARFYELLGDMEIVDPRGNMRPMIVRMWRAPDGDGQPRRGSLASWHAFYGHNFTYSGLLESMLQMGPAKWQYTPPELKAMIARLFAEISPHAPQTLRLKIELAGEPTVEQLAEWEAEAGEDPVAFATLGNKYFDQERYEEAIRTFERSIELSATKDAYVSLANAYRASGQEELWLPTLERFFEVENLGLEHAKVHELIAYDFIDKGKWEEAEPHAAAAADTWASWGLSLASMVNEGLGRWEESEKWIREDSTSYPTYSGDGWYFWCRRTGRGDISEAKKLAQQFLTADWVKTSLDGQLRQYTFSLLENDARSALAQAQQFSQGAAAQEGADDIVYYQLHLALVAHELKEAEVEKAAVAEVRRLSEAFKEQYPDYSDVNLAVCKVLEGDMPSADELAKIDQQIETKLNKNSRCNYEYFLGRAFDLHEKRELAEKYWKRCVTRGPFTKYNATLAGKYLSDRHKTSRP